MQGCSPEQISWRLPIDFPDDASMQIRHEAIYQGSAAPAGADWTAKGVPAYVVGTRCGCLVPGLGARLGSHPTLDPMPFT